MRLRLSIYIIFSLISFFSYGANFSTSMNDSIAIDSIALGISNDSTSIRRQSPKRITPVDIDDAKPKTVLHYFDKHGEPLETPVMFLATLDTITQPKSKPVYPTLNGFSIGLNFADAIMMLAGQKHQSFDLSADVSLWNWIFPTAEVGIGYANFTPQYNNYTYISHPSFYTKLGFNYNFLYKSDTTYQLYCGARIGYSNFRYSLRNVTISDSYWQENQTLQLNKIPVHALYGEILGGIKVRIVKNFSLGWNARYHLKFKNFSKSASTPIFIPGYGTSSPININFSAYFTFGEKRNTPDPEILKSISKKLEQ